MHTKCLTVSVPDEGYSRDVVVHTKCFTVSIPDEGYSRDMS